MLGIKKLVKKIVLTFLKLWVLNYLSYKKLELCKFILELNNAIIKSN